MATIFIKSSCLKKTIGILKDLFFLILLIGIQSVSYAQKIKVKTVSVLPDVVQETSGLITGANQTVWTHNDSGGKAILYQINIKGEIIRQVRILKVKNIDWEDMANDYLGHVYIADFGNNSNHRKDLRILRIPHPDSLSVDSVIPEIITFKYDNQKSFPPDLSQKNFDAEALVAYQDSLFIFTKNRTRPYSKYTYVYRLSTEIKPQVAQLYDSIYLSHTHRNLSWVTGASRHPKKDWVVLTSHKKAWILKDFRSGNRPLINSKISGLYSQKEAIAFDKNSDIWISNEKFKFLKPKLKKGILKD